MAIIVNQNMYCQIQKLRHNNRTQPIYYMFISVGLKQHVRRYRPSADLFIPVCKNLRHSQLKLKKVCERRLVVLFICIFD